MTDDASAPRGGRPGRGLAVAVGAVVVVGLAALLGVLLRTTDDPSGPGATVTTTTRGEAAVGTTAPTTPSQGLGEGWAPEVRGRRALRGFGEVAVTITAGDGTTCQVCLLAATTAAQRERGLMEVTDRDLGGYDGMLFEYERPVDGAFWMRNTPLPLSIAYFGADRTFVSATDMAPCADSPTCREYPADAPFQYALEVPEGRLPTVGVTGRATFVVTASRCPLATAG